MATVPAPSSLDRKLPTASPSTIRPNLRHTKPPLGGSPHTPLQQRAVLSPYSSSPGSSFRQEEDAVILELGSRWLRAGFEGDSAPICVVGFGPEERRRV